MTPELEALISPKNHVWRIANGKACCDRCGSRVTRHGNGTYTWHDEDGAGSLFGRMAPKDGSCIPVGTTVQEMCALERLRP